MPFEILGHGLVGYTIKQVGDSDNADDLGQTFGTTEYYCLANNGQTWYFAVADGEVYYCRQLDPAVDLRNVLNSFDFGNINPDNFHKYFKFRLGGYELVEYGAGSLTEAEGRALPDSRNYNQFQYWDFKYAGKTYSLDIFPDGKTEWFETVNVPENQLTKIFEESLRLNDPEVQSLLKSSKLWTKIALTSFALVIFFIFSAFYLSIFKQEVSRESLEVLVQNGQETQFAPLKISPSNQFYTIEASVVLPEGKGLNLDLGFLDQNKNLISNTNQELYNYLGSDSEDEKTKKQNLTISTEFFAKNQALYTPIIKINDYGDVGQSLSANSGVDCVKQELPNCVKSSEKVKINLVLYRGGVIWFYWIFAAFVALIIGFLSYFMAKRARQKTWK